MLIETVCLQTNAVIASEFMKIKFGVALHGVRIASSVFATSTHRNVLQLGLPVVT